MTRVLLTGGSGFIARKCYHPQQTNFTIPYPSQYLGYFPQERVCLNYIDSISYCILTISRLTGIPCELQFES